MKVAAAAVVDKQWAQKRAQKSDESVEAQRKELEALTKEREDVIRVLDSVGEYYPEEGDNKSPVPWLKGAFQRRGIVVEGEG